MILPIYAYGNPVLLQEAEIIDKDYPNLEQLITNMWETMENANGVGLAAPQIGLSICLFIINSVPMFEEAEQYKGIKRVFINAELIEETGETLGYEEGCLSIPDLRGEVFRPSKILLRYQNEQFEWKEETFDGLNARVIQHEYDHTDGILFTELLRPIKKRRIARRLKKIKEGNISVEYRMKFVK